MENTNLSKWLNNIKSLKDLGFTDREIDKAINDLNINLSDLTEVVNKKNIGNIIHEVIQENVIISEKYINKEWFKVYGTKIRCSKTFQNVNEILLTLLNNRINWFHLFTKRIKKKFASCYCSFKSINEIPIELRNKTMKEVFNIINNDLEVDCIESLFKTYVTSYNNNNLEIYLETELGKSAYIDLISLLNNNWDGILKSIEGGVNNHNYCTLNKKEHITLEQILNSREVKQLKYFIDIANENVWSEIKVTEFDDDIICVDGYISEDENEQGSVIAQINVNTKQIAYFNEKAKYNKYAQEIIREELELIK